MSLRGWQIVLVTPQTYYNPATRADPNLGVTMRYSKKNIDLSIFAKFVVAHAMCSSVDELAEILEMDKKQVQSTIVNLKKQGVMLKKYRRGRKPDHSKFLNSLYKAALSIVEKDDTTKLFPSLRRAV